MKRLTFLFTLLFATAVYSQVQPPVVLYYTNGFAQGTAQPHATLLLSETADFLNSIEVYADENGDWSAEITFTGDVIFVKALDVPESERGQHPEVAPVAAQPAILYQAAADGRAEIPAQPAVPARPGVPAYATFPESPLVGIRRTPTATLLTQMSNPDTDPRALTTPKGSKIEYKAVILNTNFSIPIVRLNFLENTTLTDEDGNAIGSKQGEVELFNSVGAGFGFSWGRIYEIYDDKGEIVNQTFRNTFAIHAGALFSAGGGEEKKNVFAPLIALSVLDFQVGVGVELGNLPADRKRVFLTLNYAIPLYKLANTGFWIIRRDKGTPNKRTDPKFSKISS